MSVNEDSQSLFPRDSGRKEGGRGGGKGVGQWSYVVWQEVKAATIPFTCGVSQCIHLCKEVRMYVSM